MNNIFAKISKLLAQRELQKHERKKQGNEFNVFSILGLSSDETRLHSAMIAELLNPKGAHGQGTLFLNEFLQIFDLEICLDVNSVVVEVEYTIGNISKDKHSGGRIDILIKDAACSGIIIENKIDACDQPFQLLRYHNFAKQCLSKFAIIYLTKDGKEASSESVGDEDFNYVCFSYQEDILPWLERCLSKLNEHSQVAMAIKQYIQTLTLILDIMDNDLSNEIFNVATQPDNIDAAIAIMEQADKIKKHVRDEFIERLVEKLRKRGYETEIDDDFCDTKLTSFYIWQPGISKDWRIVLRSNYRKGSNMFYAIEWCGENNSPIHQRELSQFTPILGKEQTREWPMGSEFFFGATGKRGSGNWYDWNNASTIRAMTDGKLMKFIMEGIIDKVERYDALRILASFKMKED